VIDTFFEPTLVQVFAPKQTRESPKISGTYAALAHLQAAAAKAYANNPDDRSGTPASSCLLCLCTGENKTSARPAPCSCILLLRIS
jgi:hypothetical protein